MAALLLFSVCWLYSSLCSATLSSNELTIVQSFFPKATRIDEKLADFPVYPVYQLQQLLGYAYESADLTDLPGFSGKPIRLLIGLDTSGQFTGVQVLEHHEPVFLHGLGQAPLYRFISQYQGRHLTEHIVVNSRKQGTSSGNKGPVYIDGVTKATVSVIIINDSILSSALQVARNKLEGFTQAPAVRARSDLYQPLGWQQLREKGYVGRWQLSQPEVEATLGQSISNYPNFDQLDDSEYFSEIFYAYLNAPTIGRNLLGRTHYQELMNSLKPGEQVFAVMSRGAFLHVPDGFKPGTVPGRLSLEQNQLAIELRDLDALDESFRFQSPETPEFDRINLFRVKGHAGFNPGEDATLQLNVELNRNHLIQDQATFSTPIRLPQELFETVAVAPVPERDSAPLWLQLWQERWAEVAILIIALTVLSLFFVRQRHYSRNAKRLHRFRWGYLWFTLVFIGLYAQGQLSVVNIYTLLLSIYDGFDIRIFLLDPIIFTLWIYCFLSLFLWGRGLYCGWLCPFGALQEMLSWLAMRLKLRQWRLPDPWHRQMILVKYPILLGLVITSFYSLTLAEQLAEIEPFKTSMTLFFVRSWPFVLYALVLLGLGLFMHKFYCRYLCPLGAALAVIGRLRLFSWLSRIEQCGSPCQLCKRRCEINAIRRDGSIDYDECIQCLECVAILQDENQCVATLQRRKRSRSIPERIASDRNHQADQITVA
ncbi:ferredoxin [Motiliproteus sp. MSK22-1]|nr:ferredoxin [Motiliproteus sp. MSK22-1]